MESLASKRAALEAQLSVARGGLNNAHKPLRWDLRTVAEQMRSQIGVKDRKLGLGLKVQPMCFLGNEAVSYLTATATCDNEAQAIELGNALIEQGLIAEISQEHAFRDKPYLYRFAEDEYERLSAGSKAKFCAMPYNELCQHAERMRADIGTGDREHKGRTVPKCFAGETAVAWMLQTGRAKTEVDALALGNAMLRVGLFQHTAQRHIFECGPRLYRFADHALALILARKERRDRGRPRSSSFDPAQIQSASSLHTSGLADGARAVYSEPGTPLMSSPRASVRGGVSAIAARAALDDSDDEDELVLQNIFDGLMREEAAQAAAANASKAKALLKMRSTRSITDAADLANMYLAGDDECVATAPTTPFTPKSPSSKKSTMFSDHHCMAAELRESIAKRGVTAPVAYPPAYSIAAGNCDWQYVRVLQGLLLLFPAPPSHTPLPQSPNKRMSMPLSSPRAVMNKQDANMKAAAAVETIVASDGEICL